MDKFARLVKYGSNGFEPYSAPVANPVYPPLNSNLRIILEHGNEMGWSAIQPTRWSREDLPAHRAANNSIWQAINFDNSLSSVNNDAIFRYNAWRTVKMSQAMRAVWGDAAMGDQVRVTLFGQYQQHFQNTMCQYIDDYFNNGAGNYVSDPRPVSDHLWGAGLAVYYGGENIWAESDKVWLQDRSFEGYSVQPSKRRRESPGGAWSFEGKAGVANFAFNKTSTFRFGLRRHLGVKRQRGRIRVHGRESTDLRLPARSP